MDATTTRAYANRLFYASCLSLIVTGMTFSIRAGFLTQLGIEFNLTNAQLGLIASAAFLGFPLSVIIGGALVDIFGMGRLLMLAFIGHLLGIGLTIFAGGFMSLLVSTLLVGIANGLVEAACNPLVATLYPTDKVKMLNRFHMWFPGGVVIGGLLSFGLTALGLGWKVQMASMLLPTLIYGVMFIGKKFPATERVASGVTTGEMFRECLRPLFLFMMFCMLLTASTEFTTGQWIDNLLKASGISPILLLVFINGIMVVGRLFAGPIVHNLAPTGMLVFSAFFATCGLFWLSRASGYEAYAAAAVFAIGICYFWPTMLGFVSENLPKTGAIGMSLMGGIGMFSQVIMLPVFGVIMDTKISELVAPTGYTLEQLQTAAAGSEAAQQWSRISLEVGSTTLQYLNIIPAVVLVLFVALFFYMRGRKVEKLTPAAPAKVMA